MRNTGRLALAISSGLALSAGLLAPSSVAANDTDEAIMLILDASGSMRGRIDGDTKMVIAKARIGDVFGALPAGKAIGLMAYGHCRLGDCSDIETLVPVEAGAAGRVVDAVNALSPRGKTPLASTVLMAADELRFQERPATVVLVTDGIESCEGDPCALPGSSKRRAWRSRLTSSASA